MINQGSNKGKMSVSSLFDPCLVPVCSLFDIAEEAPKPGLKGLRREPGMGIWNQGKPVTAIQRTATRN